MGYIIYGVKDIVGISDAKGTLLSCVCMYMLLLSFFWCVPVIICPCLVVFHCSPRCSQYGFRYAWMCTHTHTHKHTTHGCAHTHYAWMCTHTNTLRMDVHTHTHTTHGCAHTHKHTTHACAHTHTLEPV